jgi:hypothetical protein
MCIYIYIQQFHHLRYKIVYVHILGGRIILINCVFEPYLSITQKPKHGKLSKLVGWLHNNS